jgi:small conductance mechanosensitive channel
MFEKLGITTEDFKKVYGYIPSIITALILFFVGLWVIKKISKITAASLKKAKIDEDLSGFLISLISVVLKIFLALTVASTLGFQTTSFLAILGSAFFAVGLALQGTLSNFASGVLILIFKPYNTGDHIKVGDSIGEVESIQIFNTILLDDNKQTIIIPNSQVLSGVIKNQSIKENIIISTTLPMPYINDFGHVKDLISNELIKNGYENVAIQIKEFKDLNYVIQVNLSTQPKGADDVTKKVNEFIYKTLYDNKLVMGAIKPLELQAQ